MSGSVRVKWNSRRAELFTLGLSIITGIMIWVYVDSRRTEERTLMAALDIGLPPGWRAEDKLPQSARVILRGPRTIMGGLRPDEIRFFRTIELPQGASDNQEVRIELTRDDLRGLPRDVGVVDIPDAALSIHLVRPVRRYIPVSVQTKGETPKGYGVTRITFSPEYVAVYAPAEEFSGQDVAQTAALNLAERTSSFGTYVDLEPLKLRKNQVYLSDPVFVQVTIGEKEQRETVDKVPVSILLATPMENLAGGKLIPPQVSVVVEGGTQAMKSLAAGSLTVYIDTKEMGSSIQGEYVLRCRALAPEGIKVVSVNPPEVRWVIPKARSEPAPAAPAASPPAEGITPAPSAAPAVPAAPATPATPTTPVTPVAPAAPGASAAPADNGNGNAAVAAQPAAPVAAPAPVSPAAAETPAAGTGAAAGVRPGAAPVTAPARVNAPAAEIMPPAEKKDGR